MLDFRIHTFLAVCRHMNFTRAAEELHITQPGVSRHIHQLEEAYGVRLFAYEGKKAVLTEAGRRRGFLLARGEIDTERMARVLLEEYRSCKIGRFTLEDPPERTEACATN